MKKFYSILLILCILTLAIAAARAQDKVLVEGTVLEESTGEPLVGAHVSVQGKLTGTTTKKNGTFQLSTATPPPFTLIVSMVGYMTGEVTVESTSTSLEISLSEGVVLGREIVISASRVEEHILSSPVSIEKEGISDIHRNSAANFYDGLYRLKGVDMNVSSLLFRFPNTRGFTGESNFRMNQMIDGVENYSPGLSFAAGNMFGLSELDVESVELLVGASSALYGPGGVNGTLLMTSKNPFEYQGLSFKVQAGLMHVNADYRENETPLADVAFRYAKAFNQKAALKITGEYLRAHDWNASNFRDRTDLDDPSLTRETNPGYDGVNVYGDDIVVPVNLKNLAPSVADGIAQSQGLQPGTPGYDQVYNTIVGLFPDQVVSRTGWQEKYIGDYNTENLKLNGALHYRLNENVEAIAQAHYNKATSLYTTTNRFSLKNFRNGYGKLEVKSPDFFVRAWTVLENSGDSYDLGGAALLLNEAWKSSENWYADYVGAFTQSILGGSQLEEAYAWARMVADNRDQAGNVLVEDAPAFPLPGSEVLDSLLQQIITKPVTEGGAIIQSSSKILHTEAMYDFSDVLKVADLIIGGNYRRYWIDSRGTVFADEPGDPISFFLFGAYAQASRSFWNERMKASASVRYDKHEQFKGAFTPRLSLVYAVDRDRNHNLRASYQTAFRFPSTADQWTDFNAGYYTAVGGLREVQEKYDFYTNPVYRLSGSNPITSVPVVDEGPYEIPEMRPEKVRALEVGYRGLSFEDRLYIDAYVYTNQYEGFIAAQLLAQNPNTPQERRYQTYISTDGVVSSFGWAIGADLALEGGYYMHGNIAYNTLESGEINPGRQNRYNTPDYRFGIGLGNRNVVGDLGFDLFYRWQNTFLWESNFGVARIPAFGTLDAHISYRIPALKSMIKLGGSNILNQYYNTSFGSSQVGGLYYISILFDQFMN
jgi:outer membrane receptor protein involved in Fe transport